MWDFSVNVPKLYSGEERGFNFSTTAYKKNYSANPLNLHDSFQKSARGILIMLISYGVIKIYTPLQLLW